MKEHIDFKIIENYCELRNILSTQTYGTGSDHWFYLLMLLQNLNAYVGFELLKEDEIIVETKSATWFCRDKINTEDLIEYIKKKRGE